MVWYIRIEYTLMVLSIPIWHELGKSHCRKGAVETREKGRLAVWQFGRLANFPFSQLSFYSCFTSTSLYVISQALHLQPSISQE